MEAVLSPRGRITIPIDIRRMLGLRGGDRVVINKQGDSIVIRNGNESPAMKAWRELQEGFAGEAERVGWTSEDDVVKYCKEIRGEMWEERYGHSN